MILKHSALDVSGMLHYTLSKGLSFMIPFCIAFCVLEYMSEIVSLFSFFFFKKKKKKMQPGC